VLRQFVGDKHPTQFMFSAAADEPSRVSLYKRMANKLVNSIPYTMKIIDKSLPVGSLLSLERQYCH
jgi:hypothetical protein